MGIGETNSNTNIHASVNFPYTLYDLSVGRLDLSKPFTEPGLAEEARQHLIGGDRYSRERIKIDLGRFVNFLDVYKQLALRGTFGSQQ